MTTPVECREVEGLLAGGPPVGGGIPMRLTETTPLERTPARGEQGVDGWETRSGLDIRQVETLLDWLEVCGYTHREVLLSEDQSTMTVRWKR